MMVHELKYVPRAGLEPARLVAPDFKSDVSTDFTTEAEGVRPVYFTLVNLL